MADSVVDGVQQCPAVQIARIPREELAAIRVVSRTRPVLCQGQVLSGYDFVFEAKACTVSAYDSHAEECGGLTVLSLCRGISLVQHGGPIGG